jgi:hypothetical protein
MQLDSLTIIEKKIDQYIQKFYLNELLKGVILFFSTTLLYFITTTALEYFLWLSTTIRAILFWSLIIVSVLLLSKFILWPLAKLFKLSKGIDYNDAANQIGKYFPEVSDKLTNLLQLKSLGNNDELILAGIEQKAKELKPIPFQLAINLRSNTKYLKYAIPPTAIIIGLLLFGKLNFFTDSYKRVINYETTYEPPAPFIFNLNNKSLEVNEGESLQLSLSTLGEVVPDQVKINYNNQSYLLQQSSFGNFTHTIDQISKDFSFYFQSNNYKSITYNVKVIKTPRILDFKLALDYPAYTKISDKTITGQGSMTVPEGTNLTWKITTKNTDSVVLYSQGKQHQFLREKDSFSLQKKINKNLDYNISTSNAKLKDFENLSYNIKVIKDQYPKINVVEKLDTTDEMTLYYQGKVSDDYGISQLKFVYYSTNTPSEKQYIDVNISKNNYNQFYYIFPNEELDLTEGETYQYYFIAYDNDAVNGSKSSKSQIYGYKRKTKSEVEEELLNKQNKDLDSLKSSLKDLKSQKKDLEEIQQLQKEKQQFNYSDKQKLSQFIERQKQQRLSMNKYMKSLKNSLEQFNPKDKNPEKEALQQRLKNNEKLLQKNEELLKELEEYQEKLDNEELQDKLEKFSKSSKQQERSLEQLLELTKRYYVEQKAQKLAEALNKLAEAQEKLSQVSDEKESKIQEKLNEEFDNLQKELDKLEKENNALKEPMQLERDEIAEEQVKQEQQKAQDKLNDSESDKSNKQQQEQSKQSANQNQKKAADKMKQMSSSMAQSMSSMSAQQNAEDAEMLKQILDNLITFSKEQEDLMNDFKLIEPSNPTYASKIRRQGQLRENFEHIDDSLFALALRNPMISDNITIKLTDIQFDIEKSLERLAETQIRLGTTSQQYVMVNSNELANLLDSSLDNMQMSSSGSGQGSSGKGKPGQGQGEGQGFQLSDIIKSHEELSKKMGEQGKKKGQQQGEGNTQGQQENGKDGQNSNQQQNQGKDGGSSGQDGKNGDQKSPGLSEEMSGELFEIYKQQQALRDQLEDRIEELGLKKDAQNLDKSLDQLEQDMLMNGFSSDVLKQMENIKHQLLKLDKAAQQQGQDSKRQATTNYKDFNNTKEQKDRLKEKEFFETLEILNRQQLPLQIDYKELIKKYFNESSY